MADYCNETKHRLLKGEKLSGCWIQLASTIASEIIADSGYDIALIDCEHAPIEIASLVGFFQAMKGSGIMPMVRAPWNDMVAIKRILDCGAPAIHIPYITGYEEAVKAVKYCKYPLEGVRGIAGAQRANFYGDASHHYRERANEEILVMLAIETPGAIEELDKIVTIPGLDGIFIGPVDLSTSMGHFCDPSHPEVQEAIRRIESIVLKSGKLLATVAPTPEKAIELYGRGYSYLIVGSDERYVRLGASKDVKALKAYLDPENAKIK